MSELKLGKIESSWLGQINFEEGLLRQEECFQKTKQDHVTRILGLEHRAVLTLGKRGNLEEDLVLSAEEFHARGYEIVRIDRGGQATLHQPGQLVIYPILHLQEVGFSIKDYVSSTLKSIADIIEVKVQKKVEVDLGNAGIYFQGYKLAYCGIRVREGITGHGFAINIDNPIGHFDWIRSCGVSKAKTMSLKKLGWNGAPHDFFEDWLLSIS